MEKYLDYIIDPNDSINQYKQYRQILKYFVHACIAQELLLMFVFLIKYGFNMSKASSAKIED